MGAAGSGEELGSGERANRQSSSWGDGVYLSRDGGKTWRNQGSLTLGGNDYLYFGCCSSGTNTLINAAAATLTLESSNSTPLANWSGTSMATPHVAGAAALVKSTNLALTADQVMSALHLTARPSVKRFSIGDPVDPHHQGSGMVDVAKAARAGLYLEVPAGSFRAARSSVFTGGAENLNLPTMAHGGCFNSCVLTRTFKAMPGAVGTTYSVQASIAAGATITPSVGSFAASAGGTAVNFTISAQDATLVGDWVYGEVRLVNTSGDGRPDLRLPLAVYFSPLSDEAGAPAEIVINASHERGFQDVEFDSMLALPNARFVMTDLAAAAVQVRNITADPTNDDAFDNVAQNYSEIFQVPALPGAPVVMVLPSTGSAIDEP